MKILALDIGKKHTGVAYADSDFGILSALPTIHHKNADELIFALREIIDTKKIDSLILGLPLLLDGTEGEQAEFTKEIGDMLKKRFGKPIQYIDERLSNLGNDQNNDHAKAACSLAQVFLDRRKNHSF